MRPTRLALAAALATALSVPALAQPAPQESGFPVRNAGELATLCEAKAPDPRMAAKLNFCFGYAQGVVHMEQARGAAARKFCFPTPTPSRASTMGAYAKWVKGTPANAGSPTAESVIKFMVETYPCKPA
jgi:hypothetical protein